MPLLPLLPPAAAGSSVVDVVPVGGTLLLRMYGDPSEPPDHCPNAASPGFRASSRSFATTRPRPVGPASRSSHIANGARGKDIMARTAPPGAALQGFTGSQQEVLREIW